MRVPLYVSPAGASYPEEWEPVETLVISMYGGMIRSRKQFPVGTTLDIRKRDSQRFTRGRVVWTAAGAREFATLLPEGPGVAVEGARNPAQACPRERDESQRDWRDRGH